MPSWLERLAWWRPPFVLRQVILTLTDEPGTGIGGVLWSSRGPWLTLKQASLMPPGEPPKPIEGDVVIERRKVSFVVVVGEHG